MIFFFAYAVTVSNFSELFIYAATVFFLPELILHKFSVEGYRDHSVAPLVDLRRRLRQSWMLKPLLVVLASLFLGVLSLLVSGVP